MKNKTYSVLFGFALIVSAVLLGFWLRSIELSSPDPEPNKQPTKAIKVAALGDVSCPPNKTVTDKSCQMLSVRDLVKKALPDYIFLLGDLQYDKGETQNFTSQFTPLWSDLKSKTFAAPGNHEYYTQGAKGYFDYWNGTENNSLNAGERNKGYYSFKAGKWHVVSLNSNCEQVQGCDKNSAQGRWLAEDLKASKSQCTLAFWHHPHFTSGRYASNKDTLERGTDFWKILDDSGADIVLNGHDHLYERMAQQNADGSKAALRGGIRQFIVGTGGRSLYDFTNKSPNHEFGVSTFGFLELSLKEISYSWKFFDNKGQVLDHGSGVCNNP